MIDNTAFLIAQYLCWTEIIRRQVQFVNLEKDGETKRLQQLQGHIRGRWASDRLPPIFRIFAGEQSAIGEAVIQYDARGPECIGYGGFLKTLGSDKDVLIDALRQDVTLLVAQVALGRARLTEIQHALIDLIDMLDPNYFRFPKDRRSKA